jgi:hypothetical protein
MLMLRVVSLVLLIAPILTVAVQAQRSGAAFQGHAPGVGNHSGFLGQHRLSNAFSPHRSGVLPNRFHVRQDSLFLPYSVTPYDPFWYEQSAPEEADEPASPVVIDQANKRQLRMREMPVPKSQIIEMPRPASSTAAKTLTATIFILKDGERFETLQFLLTARDLCLNVDGHHRTIPLLLLNRDATIAVNRERGIDFRIPTDLNEISLSF